MSWRFVAIALLSILAACANGAPPLSQPNDVGTAGRAASSYALVHSFDGPPADGWVPIGDLISGSSGRLYGVTNYGGSYAQMCNAGVGCGTFFTFEPSRRKESVLCSFGRDSNDSQFPSSVSFYKGRFYGTAQSGGSENAGTVFQLNPPARKSGEWKETILYSFHHGRRDGSNPTALTFDAAGDVFGVALAGGGSTKCPLGCGVIFELTPPPGEGRWRETILHSFVGRDGAAPNSLIRTDNGLLYGETNAGGDSSTCGNLGCGTVFALNARGTLAMLHSFTENEGSLPFGGLVSASNGTLYGVAAYGGLRKCNLDSPRIGCGAVFALRRSSGRHPHWTESTLYRFAGSPSDGSGPNSIVSDGAGGFYGETVNGGAGPCRYNGAGCGTLFHLTLRRHAKWADTIAHSFDAGSSDGWDPGSVAIFGKTLYGLTLYGGAGTCNLGCGTIYELRP